MLTAASIRRFWNTVIFGTMATLLIGFRSPLSSAATSACAIFSRMARPREANMSKPYWSPSRGPVGIFFEGTASPASCGRWRQDGTEREGFATVFAYVSRRGGHLAEMGEV